MSTPAAEVRSFAVTIPAGTPQADPVTTQIFFPARDVTGVSWRVPPGPSGLMGWQLTMSGGQVVIPTGGGWIVADDQYDTWPLTGFPDSGYWEVTGYNTGAYDHTVYLDFLLDLVTEAVTSPALVSIPAGGVTTPATIPVSTPGVSIPVPPVSVPPVSIPAVSVPPVSTPPPVSVPPVSVPPPVTVKQPVFADVIIPNVVNMRRDAAVTLLRKAGLQVTTTAAAGTVTAQSPAAGKLVKSGSEVKLTVKSPHTAPAVRTVKVPNVTGKRREDAGPVIRAAGLVASFSKATGTVVKETPKQGTEVKAGSTVKLELQ